VRHQICTKYRFYDNYSDDFTTHTQMTSASNIPTPNSLTALSTKFACPTIIPPARARTKRNRRSLEMHASFPSEVAIRARQVTKIISKG